MKNLIKFLSSLKFGLVILISILVSLIVSTFFLNLLGFQITKALFYESLWFQILFWLLFLNILLAIFSTYPWRKKHIGFVLAHSGILFILIGAFLSLKFSINGLMPIEEGLKENRIFTDKLIFKISHLNGKFLTPIKETDFILKKPFIIVKLSDNTDLVVDKYLPHSTKVYKVIESPIDGIGLKAINLRYSSNGHKIDDWFFISIKNLNHWEFLGNIFLKFSSDKLSDKDSFFAKQDHIPKLQILVNSSNQLFYKYKSHHNLKLGKIKTNEKIKLNEKSYFIIKNFIEHALEKVEVRAIKSDSYPSSIHVNLINSKSQKKIEDFWLFENEETSLFVGSKINLLLERQSFELPFSILLKKFIRDTYSGSKRASSYESVISILDKQNEFGAIIKMNNPISYGGFRFYQTAFQKKKDGKYISILSVNLDSGRILKYIGSIFIICGIIFMCFIKTSENSPGS